MEKSKFKHCQISMPHYITGGTDVELPINDHKKKKKEKESEQTIIAMVLAAIAAMF